MPTSHEPPSPQDKTSVPENLLILSDLHINEGWLAEEGGYSSREDFFYDRAFFDLLRHHHALSARDDGPARGRDKYRQRPWLLVLNGDTFDFEQVVALPPEGEALRRACGVETHAELGERARFGLETSEPEGRWKLRHIAQGHPLFFAALGWFVAHGHRVLFIKGNHDPELYWPGVQDDLRSYALRAYRRYRRRHRELPRLTRREVDAGIAFEPWFYYDPHRRIYVEHGNQYEPSNHFPRHLAPIDPQDPAKLELPDGMLMTRYVFNRLEDSYPYADNVRPVTRVFGWILADSPLAGVRVFLARAGDLVRGWTHIWQRKRAAGATAPASAETEIAPHGGLPLELVREIQAAASARMSFSWKNWGRLVMDQGVLSLLTLAGLASGVAGLVNLARPGKARKSTRYLLAAFALLNSGHLWSAVVNDDRRLDYMPTVAASLAQRFREAQVPLRAVVLGHTHIARRDWLAEQGTWMANTGAWMPTLVQHPHTWALHLTFVRIAAGAPAHEAPELLAWDRQAQVGRPYNLPEAETSS